MDSVKYKVTWKTFLLPAVGILAFVAYLYLFNIDIPSVIATAQTANPPLYFMAMLFVLIDTLFFSLSWRTLLNFLSVKISAVRSYLYVWYGIYMDIIIPAESVSGEITRVYLVTREQNGTSGKVVASLVTHRLMGMSINVASLVVGIFLLLAERQVGGLVLTLTLTLLVVTTVFLVLLVLLCVRENWTLKIIDLVIKLAEWISRGRWRLTKMREDAIKAAQAFHSSMKEFGHAPRTMSISMLLSVISWLFSLGVAYLVFLSLGYDISWSVIIISWSIVVAVKAIPFGVPFELGVPEITMTTLYTILGVPMGIAATATVLNRILTLWLRFFLGFLSQQWLEFKMAKNPCKDNRNMSGQSEKA